MPDKARSEDSVFHPCHEWHEMQTYRKLITALRGGTAAIRAEYPPPQYAKEDPLRYDKRIANTYLLDAFDRAMRGYSDRVFSDGIVVDSDAPPWFLQKMENGVDGRGTPLSSWAPPVFQEGRAFGGDFILTDATAPKSGRATSYWTLHTTESVIGWRFAWSDKG